MRLVAPFGFYGAGNIGDEATLNGFAQLLRQAGINVQVSVGSRNPRHTARMEPAFRYFGVSARDPRRWVAKLLGNAHAVIGGTPIMDIAGDWPLSELSEVVRGIDRWKVPMVFVGIGMETLRSPQSRRKVAEEIVPRVQHWSVRSDRDRQRLVECGASPDVITTAADMAWLIEPATDTFGRECLREWGLDDRATLIGVNLVNEEGVFKRHPGLIRELACALDQISIEMDAKILFLSNEIRGDSCFDRAAASEVVTQMKCKDAVFVAPARYFSPQQMMSIIACCEVTLSMRYHFCMFSALQGVPFVAIERSDKVSDLCWDINWSASVTPSKFQGIEAVGEVERLRQDAPALRGQLKQCVERMRKRAYQNVEPLNAIGLGNETDRRSLLAC